MSVRLPGLLLPDLTETRRLRPTAGSLTVKMIGSSEASITMPEDEAADVRIRDWVSIYDEDGFAGIFRVTNVAQPLKKQVDLTLLHGIDILSDSVWPAQTEFEGTKTQFLTQLLAQQTQLINGVKPWVLGVCEDTATVKRDINYDRLSALLEGLNEEGGNYWFTYDMTGFPWVLNYVHVDNTVVSEFRLTRNIRSATITYNDADLCTRLFLTVSTKTEETVPTKKLNPDYVSDEDTPDVPRIITENITVSSVDSRIKEYNNTTAQEDWGIVVKTADIDTTDDILNGHFESADAWAAAFLARRSAPSVQIQIDGDDLFDLTGDVWDRTKVGRLCQVALPAYGKAFRERVVSVTYPELFKKDEIPRTSHVTVSLSNILPRFTESLAQAEKEAATASRSSRATARAQTRDEKELTTWSKHVQWQGAALDGSGIMTLYESGINMDATGGVKIYSLENGLQGLYGELKVQSKLIEGKVGSDALNGYLRIQDLSTEIGNVMITQDGQTIAASVVTAINQSTGDGIIYLNSDRVILKDGSIITATALDTRLANVDDLFTNTGYSGTITSGVVKVITGLDIYNLSSDTYKRFSAKGIYIGNTKLDMEFLGNDAHHVSLTIPNAVTGFGTATSDATTGEITIPFYTYDNPSNNWAQGNKINFNIANTAYFQSHVGIKSLTVDPTDQAGYNDSSADPVTLTAGDYYIVAAEPNSGTKVYKKFHVPAAAAPVTVNVDKSAWSSGGITFSTNPASGTGAAVSLAFVIPANNSNGTAQISVVDSASPGSSSQPLSTGLSKNLTLTCGDDYAVLSDGGTTVARVPNNKSATPVTVNVDKGSWSSGGITFSTNPASGTGAAVSLAFVIPANNSNGTAQISVVDSASPGSSSQPLSTGLSKNLTLTCDDNYATLKDGGTTVARVPNNKSVGSDYAAGWGAAYGKVSLPNSTNLSTAYITIGTPPSTVDGNADQTKYYLDVQNYYAYIRYGGGSSSDPIVARTSHSVYTAGQQSVAPTSALISTSTLNESTGKREATLTVYYKGPDTSEDSEPLSGVDVTSIYNAGKAAGTQQSSYPVTFSVTFSDGHKGNVTADCKDIWNQGASESTVTYVYTYATGNDGGVYLRPYAGASGSNYTGQLKSNTKVQLISYADNWAYVYYSGYYGYVSCSGGLNHNFVWTTPKSGKTVVTSGWAKAPGGGGSGPETGDEDYPYYGTTKSVTVVYASGSGNTVVTTVASGTQLKCMRNPAKVTDGDTRIAVKTSNGTLGYVTARSFAEWSETTPTNYDHATNAWYNGQYYTGLGQFNLSVVYEDGTRTITCKPTTSSSQWSSIQQKALATNDAGVSRAYYSGASMPNSMEVKLVYASTGVVVINANNTY